MSASNTSGGNASAREDGTDAVGGRRERKKAATRQAISDAALRLFLERGYDDVSLREIADEADVAVATMFKHFPGKEALLFDEADDHEREMIEAIVGRAAGVSALDALEEHFHSARVTANTRDPRFAQFWQLVSSTPRLREYHRSMWNRREEPLARAMQEHPTDGQVGDVEAYLAAHLVVEAMLASINSDDPKGTLFAAFALLRAGLGHL